jgi:SAM-dependent methyltransferase
MAHVIVTRNAPVRSATQQGFLWAAFRYYGAQYFKRLLRHPLRPFSYRTPEFVRQKYDAHVPMSIPTFDDLVFGEDRSDFVLLNGRIVLESIRRPREAILKLLAREIAGVSSVTEVGCGTGRNLLYLKRASPRIAFTGIDTSPASIALARRAGDAFGLDVAWHVADATADPAPPADVIITCHVLEMMPRLFPNALRAILAAARDRVVLVEPFPELWSWDLRGVTSRLRAVVLDRLRNALPTTLRLANALGWRLHIERLDVADNPLNQPSLLRFLR